MSVARASLLEGPSLRSQLPGASDEAWRKFVRVLTLDPRTRTPRPSSTVRTRLGFGCFGLRPKRLVDLGFMRVAPGGYAFAAPMTERKLAQPLVEYNVLVDSLRRYDAQVIVLPTGVTRSGSLFLHHHLGPHALSKWATFKHPDTLALFALANGLF